MVFSVVSFLEEAIFYRVEPGQINWDTQFACVFRGLHQLHPFEKIAQFHHSLNTIILYNNSSKQQQQQQQLKKNCFPYLGVVQPTFPPFFVLN
mmetsp:Transcript_68345/g.101515  ORF Transcript_68345/g.101515 Transcript_68345/m.101515 type:complete len:93 (-) Transcript_68345:428-706(-)